MAVISKGIKLFRNEDELHGLQNIPELGSATEAIEITTLADGARTYTDGIENYGDSIPFTFLYEAEQYAALQSSTPADAWKVQLPAPDNSTFTFTGKGSVKLAGVGVNGVLTYTLSVRPTSKIEFNKPNA
jgi:hypothetical protein